MAYQENIPLSTDALQKSQGDLQGNFQALKQLIDVNHSTFGSATEGKHAKVEIPNLGVTPAFGAGDGVFYTNNSPLTGGEVFIKKPTVALPIPMTARLANANGWTYLPSGILLRWGLGTGAGNFTIVFPVGAGEPVFTGVITALVSTADISATQVDTFVRFSEVTNTTIRVFCSRRTTTAAATANVRYLVIGI